MNKRLYNEKLINFIINFFFNSNIVFGWVIHVGLMHITVDRVLSLAPSKFPSPNSLLLFPEYTPCSSSPQSFVVLLSLFQNNEERWKSLPVVILTHIFVRLLIKSIIICTSVSKTWKSKSKTQLSFPTISTTLTTKTKTSSSSGWQKKKWAFFFTYDFITNDNNKEVYRLHNENDDDPDADFGQLLMGLCIGLPSRHILIKNLIFLFWCSIWGVPQNTAARTSSLWEFDCLVLPGV